MPSKHEVREAFEAAVNQMIIVLTNGPGPEMDKLIRLSEAYEKAAGLSRRTADRQIVAEANRRLQRPHR